MSWLNWLLIVALYAIRRLDSRTSGPKQHRFVRADTHQNSDDAVAFAISKAKQIIDLQGDRMFT